MRDLSLNPACYEALNHFFRSSACSLESLWQTWFHIAKEYAPLYREQDAVVLIDYFLRRDPVSPKFRSTYIPHWIHRYAEGIRFVRASA